MYNYTSTHILYCMCIKQKDDIKKHDVYIRKESSDIDIYIVFIFYINI